MGKCAHLIPVDKMNGLYVACFAFTFIVYVSGHGYMIEPAARNSMWRKGFKNPKDYDDNGLNCGGFSIQWHKNHGKCGVCGDAAHLKVQPHNDGGRYSNGIIAATYKQGQVIDVSVILTRSHLGYFEFRIGDFTKKHTDGDKVGKLQGELMKVVEGGSGTKVPVDHGTGKYTMKLRLPAHLTCKRCVIQWWYRGGNNWGCDGPGKCGIGRGKQEHFVNCADVQINA